VSSLIILCSTLCPGIPAFTVTQLPNLSQEEALLVSGMENRPSLSASTNHISYYSYGCMWFPRFELGGHLMARLRLRWRAGPVALHNTAESADWIVQKPSTHPLANYTIDIRHGTVITSMHTLFRKQDNHYKNYHFRLFRSQDNTSLPNVRTATKTASAFITAISLQSSPRQHCKSTKA